jgi:hypothetical protein
VPLKNFSLNSKKEILRGTRILLKKSDLPKVWSDVHQHSGRDKTYEKFKNRFWFRGMSVWVREKLKDCVPCSNKHNPQWPAYRSPLIPIPVQPHLWWRVHIDLIGPLPKSCSGNKYILLAVCALSKYVEGIVQNKNHIQKKRVHYLRILLNI